MRYLEFERPIEELDRLIQQQEDYAGKTETDVDIEREIGSLRRKRQQLIRDLFYNLTPYQKIQLARHPDRPYCLDYIQLLMEDFQEFHGDRAFADDPALVPSERAPESRVDAHRGRQKLQSAIEALPEEQAQLVRMAYLEGKTHSEIAEATGLPFTEPGNLLRA